jgi:hypothetical protein
MKALEEKNASESPEQSVKEQSTSSSESIEEDEALDDGQGPSTSSGILANKDEKGKNAASDSSDSDLDLDELLSAGPIKKKAKRA